MAFSGRQPFLKKALKMAGLVFLSYGCLVAVLFLAQRSLVFVTYRVHATPAAAGVPDMSVIHVKTSDGLILEGWYKPAAGNKPVLIFFQGNGSSLLGAGYAARPFLDAGYGFLYAEYRGYTSNPGRPSESGLYKDARAYTDWLLKQPGMSLQRTVFFGQSLGTGVAVKMASEYEAAALILESPFTSLPDIAALTYFYVPVHFLMLDRFDSFSLIHRVRIPLLILHGEKDTVVPFRFGKELYDAANEPKEFAVFPEGTHMNLRDYGADERIMTFLEKYVRP